jgi:CRISPR-associated protein Csc2
MKLNAIQDTVAGGIAGSAFASRENVLPQIFIPTVETLLDVTSTEFTYVLGNILKTTRYGAESNREGFIRNHILGVYFSDVELFSNLELTQLYYDALAESAGGNLPDYLSVSQFFDNWLKVEQMALARVVGRRQKVEDLNALLNGIQALYEDEKALRSMLEALDKEAQAYVKAVKSKDKSGEEDTEE